MRTVVCENELMATSPTQQAPSDPALPLYRMDLDTYHRLVESGALDGVDVELLDGLLFDKHSHREDAIHRLDVGTYERMAESGALDGLHIELRRGLLVEVSPQGFNHSRMIEELTIKLTCRAARLRVQLPLQTDRGSVVEPDLALIAGLPPADRHLRTALLVIEVAVSSHRDNRGQKAALYAAAPVPTYWLVDVPGQAVEVRTAPGPHGYERCAVYGIGDVVPPPAAGLPGLDVAGLFADAARGA
jgi:Uma2 family endonuclease